ncbi:prophage Lp2 protein 56 [Latilactobacillus sakei subsp. carnosus DSM 15831]|uniref:GH25 family lysozyme n=1 Tax=Latilactobacillus sakei TaxID=1599 RepID=UPI00019CEE1D|nr:GH25 family lysozyme [Latilactobacillus sakei]KRL69622.1 prophage Lp2 protein 56 [Latilactobacillus sakei subsp. carnosus DSM 15831]GEP21099.1 lysin [Latilactobacillus sakei subsp. carnosus]
MIKLNKLVVATMAAFLMLPIGSVAAARTDMVDVSNHNGNMYLSDWTGMRDKYGVKSMVTKISEGTFYKDYTAANNIATAKQAGIYQNGYHFARYKTAAQAEAEGNYAASLAKQVGLPNNAVLVTDVEATEQQYSPLATNDYNNFIFMSTVQKYGYRTDIYTSGSWMNNVMTVKPGTGWIASYPYVVGDKQWYTGNHAWQFSSTQNFAGTTAVGNFDVSQLNDDFYTGGQNIKPVNPVTPPATGTVANQDYAQTGTFKASTTVNVRSGIANNSPVVATYAPGQSLNYNHIYIVNGVVKGRYTSYSGQQRYASLGLIPGQSFGNRTITTASRTYTIQYGDSFWSIANKLGINMYTLAAKTGKSINSMIYPGQTLNY